MQTPGFIPFELPGIGRRGADDGHGRRGQRSDVGGGGGGAGPRHRHDAGGGGDHGTARQEAEAAFSEENGLSEVSQGNTRGGAGSGPRGSFTTQDQLDQVRDEFLANNPDFEHVSGGRDATTGVPLPEEFIPGPDADNPKNLSVRPDLTFQNRFTLERVGVQTFTADTGGNIINREAAAFQRLLWLTGEPAIAIPKP